MSKKNLLHHRCRKEEKKMNYSYYATETPTRSLETILEDENACSTSNVYQNTVPISGERALHDANHVYQNKTPVSGDCIIHNAS